tara:strand:+ start:1943 stop:3430 length:1488 start_codon:yes stop_codon:yes gene_type:complete
MALTTPTTYDALSVQTFFGLVEADQSPLDKILLNANYFYGRHSPPLVQFSPYAAAATVNSEVYIVPTIWSADLLAYTASVKFWRSDTSAVTLAVEESSAVGSGWGAVSGSPFTLIASGGSAGDASQTVSWTPGSGKRYLKLTITNATGGAYAQLQSFMAYPNTTAVTTGAKSSGFIGYESTALATAGAPIHVEYLNRAAKNIHSTYYDRKHCVGSFVQAQAFPMRLTATASGRSQVTHPFVATMPLSIPDTDGTLTVEVLANDSGAGGKITINQKGFGSQVELDADGTARTSTLSYTGTSPTFIVAAEVHTQLDISYVVLSWRPKAQAGDFIQAIAPPAAIEYLLALNKLLEKRVAASYHAPCLVFDPSTKGATFWQWERRIPPASYSMRWLRTRHTVQAAGSASAMIAWNTSGGLTANDAIVSSLSLQPIAWPPYSHSQVWVGSLTYDATPSVPMNRLHELPSASWTAQNETFLGNFFHGTAGSFMPVTDLSAV